MSLRLGEMRVNSPTTLLSLLAACSLAPLGTHSLGTSPLEIPGLNGSEDGWKPRVGSGDAYHGSGGKPRPPPTTTWCTARIVCTWPRVTLSIVGRSSCGSSTKGALLKAQRGARGNAIADCEVNLRGKAASYTYAEYQCVESVRQPDWWDK